MRKIEDILLEEIEMFCEKHDLADSAFSVRACQSALVVHRLRSGEGINSTTINKIRHFIAKDNREA